MTTRYSIADAIREDGRIEAGSSAFRKANLAMFVGGFATFAMLYATQPILPRLASDFAVAPTTASLSVAAGTAALAAMLIPASVLSDRYGRERVMKAALVLGAIVTLVAAFAADFTQLLVLRVLLGAVLAGLPAAAMAYLGEEVAPGAQGRAIGLYIAGNALGGMSGRFLVAVLTDWSSWRLALAALGFIGVIAAALFWYALPRSHHFAPRAAGLGDVLADAAALLGDRGMRSLFAIAFLMMGAFTSLYNYLGFRLQLAPFSLGQSAIGGVFMLYLVGTASSAWTGRLVDRVGRRTVLWTMILASGCGLALTLSGALPAVITGVAVFTFGYFGAHTAASGWVGRRAHERRALAAALYLCSYYLGASLLGTLSGLAWERAAWPGVVAALALSMSIALGAAWWLRKLQPLAAPAATALNPVS
ncbi:MFS transporter [Aromatoleum anaerobium]|uniref:MFS transporter n=1 Tax=Aromatoleum anaerobium TaxID=182180 RepID=A0ABX1PHU9_9RHOO|nr:MFS transporter [Aromatoleum anaerobium]MCK0508776.1 MFS transporter [Aromatoleum anaerobium]